MTRKIIMLITILALSAIPFASVMASPAAQFAGCPDDASLAVGARYSAVSLNGFTMTVTVVGVDDFDPQVSILDVEGNALVCNDNANDAATLGVNLPTVVAEPSENSAQVSLNVPGDEGRLDYDIVVTSADGTPGEFVLLYQGAEVFGADNVDEFVVHSSQGQADSEVPLGIYVANLNRPDLAIDPALTFSFGEDFSQSCGKSSSRTLCDGDSEDLTGYTVTLDEETEVELGGDDVMLFFQLGGEAADFTIEVGSYQASTFGAYTLMIHSGTGELIAPEG